MAPGNKLSDEDSEPEFDPLNPHIEDDEGWEDAEPEEEEKFQYKSLFDDFVLPSLADLVKYDKDNHKFDLLKVKKDLKLDFIGTVRLVNFVRSEVQSGNTRPDCSSAEQFQDDKYLRPFLDDDPVLFSLGDLGGEDDLFDESPDSRGGAHPESRIQELESELRRAHTIIDELRTLSQRSFDDREDVVLSLSVEANRKEAAVLENDKSYFKSYAYNDIHETMLKDTVRTDAYRDFIYDNKDLFAGKTVLDVGCGTGILSMMCAKAGAARVFAVDNSDIINKARANVFENKLSDTITCLRGKMEETELPVDKVDIIVSEWMGYALLYESMLDSVIFARDKYLKAGGLMVPSHTTLFIAPITIPDVVSDRVEFWDNVYGFRMPAMLEGIYDEVLLRNLKENDLAGTPSPFLQLSLHSTKVADTIFRAKSFQTQLLDTEDIADGFAVWFDMFFARSPEQQIPTEMQARQWWKQGTAFTTGPGKKTTHWQQIVLLFDRTKSVASAAPPKGSSIDGTVSYERREGNDRQLDITVAWTDGTTAEPRKQKWVLA